MADTDIADHRRGRDEDAEHSDNDIEDDEIDEELALPDVLTNLGIGEKRELLRFKNTHTEIEWEEEVLRRTDLLARKIDLERLKKMTKGAASSMDGNKASKAAPKRGSKAAKASALDSDEEDRPKRRKAPARAAKSKKAAKQLSSEEEEEQESDEDLGDSAEEDFADLDDGAAAGRAGDSDDDLFDTDEEEEITNRFTKHGEEEEEEEEERPKKKKAAPAKKAKSTRLQRGRKGSDDDEEEAEDSDDSDLYGSRKKRKATAAATSRKKKTSRYSASSDDDSGEEDGAADDFDDLAEDDDDDEADIDGVKSHTPATLEDYWRIQIRRTVVQKYFKEPFFDDLMKGGFVKVLIGNPNGVKVYRVAEIASIEHDLPSYADKILNQSVTHRMNLKCGKTNMPRVRYEIISESRITESEFEVYLQSGGTALTQSQVQSRRKKQQGYINHVYTHDEISKMVSKNTGFVAQVAQTDYATALERLKKKLNEAMTRPGEEKLVLQLSRAIEKIENDSASQKVLFDRATKKNTEVNARNRRNNVERDGAAGRAGMAEEAAGGREEAIKKDPFSRRETKPKILWKTSHTLELEAKEREEREEREKAEKADNGGAAATGATISASAAAASNEAMAAGGEGAAATEETSAQLAAKKKAAKLLLMRHLNTEAFMAEMRKNVKRRLGVDPVEFALVPQRERYLSKVTAGLPALGSEERQRLKGNSKTWAEVLGR